MSGIDGLWHDGGSSASVPASLTPWPGRLRVAGAGFERDYAPDTVRVSARVGNIPRRLDLPDGSCFETLDNDAVDALFRGGGRLAHWLENRFGWALAALLCTGLAVWAMVALGIPYLAERVANAIPANLEAGMGAQTLQALDRLAFTPTHLPAEQQARGRRLLAALPDGGATRLEFRAMGDGIANAFALPGGIIVATDRLVELADKDEELQAVLAHELGHVHHRHSLRTWLQDSATALLTAAVIGDVSSISANVVVLPTLLLENHYSRAFETQADDFAAQILHTRGVKPCHLGVALRKLEEADGGGDLPDFLSTHPSTGTRIERLGGHGACGS